MTEIIKQNRLGIWVQPNSAFTAMSLLGVDSSGTDDWVEPGTDKAPQIGVDRFGRFVNVTSNLTPPGDYPSTTIQVYQKDAIAFLKRRFDEQGEFYLQRRYNGCLPLDNPTGWTWLQHLGRTIVTQRTTGGGPALPATGNAVVSPAAVKGEYVVEWVKGTIASQTTGEAEQLNSVTMITDLSGCAGYPGHDKILYTAANAGSGATANIYATNNAGSTWTVLGTDPGAADEHLGFLAYSFINTTQFRLLVARTSTDAGNPAEIWYGDFTIGAETTAPTWTSVNVGSTNGDVIQGLAWLFYDRIYAAAGGDIFISSDQGATFGSTIYSGSTAITDFAKSPVDGSVWAVGASNLILREANRSGTFNTKTGPSGGGAFSAVTVANDGTIFAGNGTAIYRSSNGAINTGGWTSLKNFGTNRTVHRIRCGGGSRANGGDSQLIMAAVGRSTGGASEFWLSADGGATWEQITGLPSANILDAVFSDVNETNAYFCGAAGAMYRYSE